MRNIYIVRGRCDGENYYTELSYWTSAKRAENALRRYRKKLDVEGLEVVAIGVNRDGFSWSRQ